MTRMRTQLLILLAVIIFVAGMYIVIRNANLMDKGDDPGANPPEAEHIHEIDTRKTQKKDIDGRDRATCTTAGFYNAIYYCSCGEKMGEEIKSESALGHNMTERGKGNECMTCGLLIDSEGLKYELVADSYYVLAGMGSCKDKNVVIPAEHEGKSVREIKAGAFSGNSSITSIKIPDSVAVIGDRAFNGCSSLKNVSLGNSVTVFGADVFKNCTALEYNQENNGNYVGNDTNPYVVLVSATDKKILSCEINPDTKVIAPGAFENCVRLTEIVIPDRVKVIGDKAFNSCIGLLSVTLGKAVTEIGEEAFMYCHKLIEVYDLSTAIEVNVGGFDQGYIGHYARNVYTSADSVSNLVNKDEFIFYEDGSVRYLMSYCGDVTTITLPADNNYEVYSHAFSSLDITEVIITEGITAIGTYAFKNCADLTTVNLPESLTVISEGAFEGCSTIESITIPSGVISIYNHAFKDCKALKSITLPASITSISDYTFMGCTSLEKINLDGIISFVGHHAFDGCKVLKAFDFSSVKTVGDYAFNGCVAIKEVNLDSVNTLGDYAFYGVSIDTLIIPKTTTSVGAYAFADCDKLGNLVIADGRSVALTFGEFAFADCISLESVTVGNKVKKLSDGMFSGCTSLVDVTVGADVSVVGNQAFYNCDDLVKISLTKVTSIGNIAFSGCSRLGRVSFGANLSSIGDHAFEGCYNLMSIVIPSGVKSIGSGAFQSCNKLVEVYIEGSTEGIDIEKSYLTAYALNVRYSMDDTICVFENDGFIFYLGGNQNYLLGYVGSESELKLPGDANGKAYEIYPYAFYKHEDLQSVDFTDASAAGIGDYAFTDCVSLTSATLSKSVESVGTRAFYNCKALKTLVIPAASALENVGAYAFYGCDLSEIALGDKVSTLGEYAFAQNGNLSKVSFAGLVRYIGDYAFKGCGSVKELSFFGGNDGVIGVSAFEDTDITEIVIPEGFVSIKENAFKNCVFVDVVSLPASLAELGKDAFRATSPDTVTVAEGNEVYASLGNCLVEIHTFTVILGSNNAVVPSTAKIIGSGAFSGCSLLTEIDLSGVIKINDGAFEKCFGLTSVTFGDNLVSLGSSAFMTCTALKSVVIPGSVSDISASAFKDCSGLETVVIGSGVKLIGDNAFTASGVATLVIGEGVEKIGSGAFSNCDSLTYVNIPEGVKTIGNSAFDNCDHLREVVIGQGNEKIDGGAFNNCVELVVITLPSTLKEVGASVFTGCKSVTTIIFDGTRSQYNAITIGSFNSIFESKDVSVVITK